jgi:hypothetical protein
MQFSVHFTLADNTNVMLYGTFKPPVDRGEGNYGQYIVDDGYVAVRDPMQIAIADGIEGPSLDAIVGKALARVGRTRW